MEFELKYIGETMSDDELKEMIWEANKNDKSNFLLYFFILIYTQKWCCNKRSIQRCAK